jgi:peroxiredoxin
MRKNLLQLPDDLPVPEDDGAAAHLPGRLVPDIVLPATSGGAVELGKLSGRTVIYAYPRTGIPDEPKFYDRWEAIPGARGCTPESCAFRDHYQELGAADAEVFGLSTQDTAFQRDAVKRLHLPFALLSDDSLAFTRALDLPTFEVNGLTLLKRLTLVVREGKIEHVFYPVFPPDGHAEEVLAWLKANPF